MQTATPVDSIVIDPEMTQPERLALTEASKIQKGGNARASWRISADTLRQNLAHCTVQKKEAVIWAFSWCTQKGIYLQDFAREVGFSDNTIDKIITGAYRDPRSGALYDIPDKLADGIARFRQAQQSIALSGNMDFVVTPTAKRIWTGCDLARESHTPVFLYGASQVGKTWSLERYAIDNNHGLTPMVRMPSSSGLGGMVRAIAEKVGVSPNCNVADLVERIKRALDPKQVLLLDEVHQLIYTYRKESFFLCLEVIRSIYDYAQCGMVISTTNVFRSRMELERKQALEQLFRRGVHRVQLGNIVLAKDARAIFEHHGFDWPAKSYSVKIDIGGGRSITEQPLEVLRQLGKEEGLKAMTERIRYARKFASKAGEKLGWKHFIQAHLTIAGNATAPEDDW